MAKAQEFHVSLRSQVLAQDERERNYWKVMVQPATLVASQTVLLLCDVWDKHWCRGATERLVDMVPRMNETVKAVRAKGGWIIHAPSGTMDFYAGTPARQRMIDAPRAAPPPLSDQPDPPLPVDASDNGPDTGQTTPCRTYSRQHPGIEIDQERDGISDDGQEVFNFMVQHGIQNMFIMGVHTNMCILERSFAIKQMVRWGQNVALVGDLTDAMYNPAKPPYVSHEEGTRLIIEYIEKFWCPTTTSEDLIESGPPRG